MLHCRETNSKQVCAGAAGTLSSLPLEHLHLHSNILMHRDGKWNCDVCHRCYNHLMWVEAEMYANVEQCTFEDVACQNAKMMSIITQKWTVSVDGAETTDSRGRRNPLAWLVSHMSCYPALPCTFEPVCLSWLNLLCLCLRDSDVSLFFLVFPCLFVAWT